MSFKHYLEMLPTLQTRAMMGKYGNSNTSEPSHDIDVPDWLLEDAGCSADAETRQKLGPNIKKGLLNYLSENAFDTKPPLRNNNLRLVITIDGKVLWGQAGEVIHQNIIAYGMCKGYIPIEERLSDYKWQDKTESINDFICLHYDQIGGDYPCSYAESYTLDTAKIIDYDIQDEDRTKYNKYREALTFLGIDFMSLN